MEGTDELQRLKGIGAVLAVRLRAAGLDGFERIAEAGEAALRGIPGINQQFVPGIVQQARLLAGERREDAAAEPAEDEPAEQLAGRVDAVREALQRLARDSRDRFAGKVSKKTGRRLAEEMVRIADALDRLPERKGHRKRTLKGLTKVERKMERLEQAGLKKFCKGIKKSRKTVAELAR